MKVKGFIMIVVIGIVLLSCEKNQRRNDAIKIVKEWTGKVIMFPENIF
jgi:hypothetical protein